MNVMDRVEKEQKHQQLLAQIEELKLENKLLKNQKEVLETDLAKERKKLNKLIEKEKSLKLKLKEVKGLVGKWRNYTFYSAILGAVGMIVIFYIL